jgi:hypothetical protein
LFAGILCIRQEDVMLSRLLSVLLWALWLLPMFMAAALVQTLLSMAIAAIVYGLIVAGILAYTLMNPPWLSEPLSEPHAYLRRWLKRLAWIWALVLLCGQVGVLVRILNENDPSSRVHDLAYVLYLILSPWIPALHDLQSDMALHGFAERAAIVTGSYAFAFAAAVVNIAVAIFVLTVLALRFSRRGALNAIPHSFNNLTGYKQLAPFIAWPLLIVAYVYFILIDTGVKVAPGRKEAFAYFETNDFELYFRILFGPAYMTVWVCALIGAILFFIGAVRDARSDGRR